MMASQHSKVPSISDSVKMSISGRHSRKRSSLASLRHSISSSIVSLTHLDLKKTHFHAECVKELREKIVNCPECCDYLQSINVITPSSIDDGTLTRFLMARQWNIEPAFEMYRECIKWRKAKGIDFWELPPNSELTMSIRGYSRVPDGDPSKSSKFYNEFYKYTGGGCFHKWDKERIPIYIERMGYHDAQSLNKKVPIEAIMQYHIKNNEFLTRVLMKECSEYTKQPIETVVIIADLKGLGLHMFNISAINILKSLQDIDQNYYPERLARVFIINAPKVFTLFWNVIKKWIDARIKSKIHILGRNHTKTLLQYIDAENLPSFLGGTCNCGNMESGCVPVPRVIEGANMEFDLERVVSARSRYYHRIDLKEERVTVECTFETQKHPINCYVAN
jgi:hypothetical protein